MATDKKFIFAGVSKSDGKYKMRFANDVMRIKVLVRNGYEDIRMVELDQPMTKVEAAKLLRTVADFQDVYALTCISDFLTTNSPTLVHAEVQE